MKKKTIAICVMTLIIVFCLISVLVTKKRAKYIMQDGVMLAMTLDGESISKFPERGAYSVAIDCENANGKWLPDEWKFVVEEITGNVVCELEFISNPKALKTDVEDKTTKHIATVPDYTKAVTLNQNEYISPIQYIGNSYSSTSGTTVTNAFTYSGTEWSSVPANLTSNKYYHFKFNIPSEGYYQLCYTMSSGYTSNRLYAYKNTTQLQFGTSSYISASSSSTSGCLYVGKMTTSDYIKVAQRAYSSGTGTSTSNRIATVSFYLKKTTEVETYDAGYRYSGKTPNNWVWFNGEKWRIIGSIPTCTSSGCRTSGNLVKIIRNDSLGAYAFDANLTETTGGWGSNTLYRLLNTHYYAKSTTNMNGQSHAGCAGYINSSKPNCDYSNIGILESSYYGQMVKNVYWNTGKSDYLITAEEAYANEIAKQTVTGKIGLMSASDWGYAADSSYHNTTMDKYTSSSNKATETSWIFNGGLEWTIIQHSSETDDALYVYNNGNLNNINSHYGYAVRPVVYLDSSVYIISGDGSESNPYIIGM